MSANEYVLVQGLRETRETLSGWRQGDWRVLRGWVFGALTIACVLLGAVFLVASQAQPDITWIHLAGITEPAGPLNVVAVLSRNSLVLAFHATACVAGFIAGASMPVAARNRTGLSRWVHVKAGKIAIVLVGAVTLFSLSTQAYILGSEGSTIANGCASLRACWCSASFPMLCRSWRRCSYRSPPGFWPAAAAIGNKLLGGHLRNRRRCDPSAGPLRLLGGLRLAAHPDRALAAVLSELGASHLARSRTRRIERGSLTLVHAQPRPPGGAGEAEVRDLREAELVLAQGQQEVGDPVGRRQLGRLRRRARTSNRPAARRAAPGTPRCSPTSQTPSSPRCRHEPGALQQVALAVADQIAEQPDRDPLGPAGLGCRTGAALAADAAPRARRARLQPGSNQAWAKQIAATGNVSGSARAAAIAGATKTTTIHAVQTVQRRPSRRSVSRADVLAPPQRGGLVEPAARVAGGAGRLGGHRQRSSRLAAGDRPAHHHELGVERQLAHDLGGPVGHGRRARSSRVAARGERPRRARARASASPALHSARVVCPRPVQPDQAPHPAPPRDRAASTTLLSVRPLVISPSMDRYDPQADRAPLAGVWEAERTWEVPNPGEPGFDDSKPKSYVLEMLPYPSGEPHVGHLKNYAIGDAIAHFRRRHGFEVDPPDGLRRLRPAGREQRDQDRRAAAGRDRALDRVLPPPVPRVGDLDRLVARARHPRRPSTTAGPSGSSCSSSSAASPTAPRRRSSGAPRTQTVLANEQVIDGRCERCGTAVDAAQARAVVLPDHRLRRAAARRLRPARVLARARDHDAAQLDRPLRGRRGRLPLRGARTSTSRSSPPAPTPSSAPPSSSSPPSTPSSSASSPAPPAEDGGARVRQRRSARESAEERGAEDREKTGVPLGRTRRQPGQRRGDPDVRRRLRADGVRHRARSWRCPATTSATTSSPRRFDLPIRRVIEGERPRGSRATTRACPTRATGRWSTPAASTASSNREAYDGDRRLARVGGPRQAVGQLPPARLAGLPPALLGLRRSRSSTASECGHRPGARRAAAGRAARGRGLRAEGQEPAGRGRGLGRDRVPAVRRPGPARDRHDGHLRRLLLVLPPLPRPAQRRAPPGTARPPTTGCRSTSTSAASSTRSCT